MGFLEYLKNNRKNDENDKSDSIFMRSVATSFFAIIVCIIFFSASTYAWFTTTIDSEETIQTSIYTLSINAEPQILGTRNEDDNLVYSLDADTEYEFTVTAISDNTTNGSTGYIRICINDEIYVSEQIDRGETLTFSLSFTSNTVVELVECWGISGISEAERDLTNNSSFVDMQKLH